MSKRPRESSPSGPTVDPVHREMVISVRKKLAAARHSVWRLRRQLTVVLGQAYPSQTCPCGDVVSLNPWISDTRLLMQVTIYHPDDFPAGSEWRDDFVYYHCTESDHCAYDGQLEAETPQHQGQAPGEQ